MSKLSSIHNVRATLEIRTQNAEMHIESQKPYMEVKRESAKMEITRTSGFYRRVRSASIRRSRFGGALWAPRRVGRMEVNRYVGQMVKTIGDNHIMASAVHQIVPNDFYWRNNGLSEVRNFREEELSEMPEMIQDYSGIRLEWVPGTMNIQWQRPSLNIQWQVHPRPNITVTPHKVEINVTYTRTPYRAYNSLQSLGRGMVVRRARLPRTRAVAVRRAVRQNRLR